jgi:hypothetical protein
VIKRTFHSLSATLPPHWLAVLLIGAAFLVTLEWAFMWSLYQCYGALPYDWNAIVAPRAWLAMSLSGWGIWRAYLINPAFQPRYRHWLQTTPWEPGDPMPMGRVEFAFQDAIWLVIAMVACWHWPGSWFLPLAFLVPYCVLLTIVNVHAEQFEASGLAIAIMAMLPLSAMTSSQPWFALGLGVAATTATLWGWRGTLQAFPWIVPTSDKFQYDVSQQQEAEGTCAWWPLVHPWRGKSIAPLIEWRGVWLLAGFCGCLAATGAATIDKMAVLDAARHGGGDVAGIRPFLPLLGVAAGAIAGAMRLYRYALWCAWPISLQGRRRTGRLIIPGYDQAFVAPAAALIAGYALPRLLLPLGTPTTATAFITMFAIVVTAVGMEPTLATWSLTGEYHMVRHTPTAKNRGRESRQSRTASRG